MAHAFGYLRGAFLAWFACGALAVSGQAPRERVFRFTVFSAKQITDLTFAPRAGVAPQKLQFYPTARSPRYIYRGVMPLRFVDSTTGAVVAEATIPANIPDALLLFTPITGEGSAGGDTKQTGLRYQVAVLDDGAARHGPGGLAIINLSGLALSGTVNKESVTLKPGLNPTLNIGASAKVTLHTSVKGKPYRSYADSVQLGRNQRALLILFPPFYKGSVEVQSRLLIDQPPAAGR